MKVVQINTVCGNGSTGKICVAISELLSQQGIENYVLYASGNSEYPLGKRYMFSWEVKWSALQSRVLGNWGFNSWIPTKRLLKELDRIKPDVVHLHNLHGHNVHLELLFSWLKARKTKVFWTFHDCWAFTAYCTYFDMVCCGKWKNGCNDCPQKKKYSWFFDRSKELYAKKRTAVAGLDLTVVTPSQWMADLTKDSFLKEHPVRVIYNGIDLNVFAPIESEFRRRYDIPETKVLLLGVANKWERRKGLDVFVRLAECLDRERFQIVLVGTNEQIDTSLPSSIISIHRTTNQRELAQIYAAADFFVNPTLEDNFPTVNLESLACGTPVIAYDTGGSVECITEKCGCSIRQGDFAALHAALLKGMDSCVSTESCVCRASEYDQNDKFQEYVNLYCSNEYD